ncbi:hypothetical protein EW145_g3038 [Phellinidium pouzarii]|uniref:DUF7702 domain-containing protein n=1 Tax=Phellinidium pouzarii TaxID=167371 RepID=A0A4V3XD09_9AGAM|nr:hypothetical protein EW145_g3038 [Phellinidium pouzarii]
MHLDWHIKSNMQIAVRTKHPVASETVASLSHYLDPRGDISVAVIIIYLVVFCLALTLTLRHGFSRQAGWLYLVTFSLFRITGGATHVAAEETSPPNTNLFITAFAFEGAGLSPLLLCAMSFLGVVGSRVFEDHPLVSIAKLRLVRLAITAGLVISIIGATEADSASKSGSSSTLRRVGAIILAICYGVIFVIQLILWQSQDRLVKFQRTLLKAISCTIPFFVIRVLYTVLSAFSPTNLAGITSSSSSILAKFNTISGSWEIYFFMGIVMELFIVSILIFFGLRLPISKEIDYQETRTDSPSLGRAQFYPPQTLGTSYPPQTFHKAYAQ